MTRLRPRSQPFEAATAAYRDGRFDACLGALQLHTTRAAFALGARALLRLGRPADALAALAGCDAVNAACVSHAELGESLMLRAAALARLGRQDDDEALDAVCDARTYVVSAACSGLEAEFVFTEAYAALLAGALDDAESIARSVLDIVPYFAEPSHPVPLQHSRARAFDLLGFVAARRERYAAQKVHAKAALDECDRAPVRDACFEANLLSNFAIFSREFGDDGYVRRRYEMTAWSDALAAQRYEVLRSLGWSNALCGDTLGAFRDLRDAAECAPTVARKIRATLDRAFFARVFRQGLIAREEIDYAERLAGRVNWADVATDEGELVALRHLAESLAACAPDRARHLFDRYRSLKPKLPPYVLAAADRRARAEDAAADAAIAAAEGNLDTARALFQEAFETWDALGYGVRAAVVARELVALGGGERFAACVADEAARRPGAWFALDG